MDKDVFINNVIDYVLKSPITICPEQLGLKDYCEYSNCKDCQTQAFKEAGLWPEGRPE